MLSQAEQDIHDAIAAQLAQDGGELVGLDNRRAAAAEWEEGPRTARAAFRWLVAACLDRAELCDGDRAEGYRRIARSIELIGSMEIPAEYSARHVHAGFRAQKNDICDRLAEMLEEEGVVPLLRDASAAPLWFFIYDAAVKRAKAAPNKIYHTYRRGHDALCRQARRGQ